MREEVLIKKGVMYFLLPSALLGLTAYLFPYVYAITPTHFAQICVCQFYRRTDTFYLIFNGVDDYLNIIAINSTMVSLYEFTFFLLLLRMIYRIRHINDDTLIKRECFVIIAIWLNLALFTLIAFFCQQIFQCDREPENDRLFYDSTVTVFWLLLTRDLSTLGVMLWYTRIVVNA
jgi:uncharacterized RDD family membrane protein YckC